MEDNKASTELIQKALTEINSECYDLLVNIKKAKSVNEKTFEAFSNQLRSFQRLLETCFAKVTSIRDTIFTMDTNIASERGLIHTREEDKGTQLDNTNYYSPKFDRNESLGLLLCQALKHFTEDFKNF